ncbi:MAG TPA: SGNH/GDSL hydrolase family protein [Polyangiaceae bacterium]|nr:SGNH/GDSL hydrolase family protein [Polyangiaceae bacterium]
MQLAAAKVTRLHAKRSAWLLGAIALCTNLACASSDANDGGSSAGAGATPAVGGAAGHAGSGVAGSAPLAGASNAGGPSVAGASSGGAGSGGTAGASVAGGFGVGGVGGSTGGVSNRGGSGGAATGGSASAGASTGGGSSAGSSGFDPCPASGDCKVLPLGDSITFGTPTNNGGYRVELFTKAVADNLHLTFVGSQSNGPAMVSGKPFPKGNEGYPGITTANLDSQHVKGTALKDMPNIILLHIGTNNVSQANAASDLEKIVDDLVAAAPNSLLAVASIIPLPNASSAVDKYNAGIPALVEKKATAGKHVIFVDQFKDFPTSELTDGVHPTDAKGYPRMGDKWYAAIKPYLH